MNLDKWIKGNNSVKIVNDQKKKKRKKRKNNKNKKSSKNRKIQKNDAFERILNSNNNISIPKIDLKDVIDNSTIVILTKRENRDNNLMQIDILEQTIEETISIEEIRKKKEKRINIVVQNHDKNNRNKRFDIFSDDTHRSELLLEEEFSKNLRLKKE